MDNNKTEIISNLFEDKEIIKMRNFMDNNKTEIISNLFEDKEIISVWDSEKEDSEVTTNCSHLKMLAQD